MSYYYSKPKNELKRIGAEAFALLDTTFSSGRKSKPKPSPSNVPLISTTHASTELYHYQYHQSNSNYMMSRRQVYVAPVETTETVVDCYQAAKMCGGTVIVDYHPKKQPAARGGDHFYR